MKCSKVIGITTGEVRYVTAEDLWQSFLTEIQPKYPWGPETRLRVLDQLQFPLVQRLLRHYIVPMDKIEAIEIAVQQRNECREELKRLNAQLLELLWDQYEECFTANGQRVPGMDDRDRCISELKAAIGISQDKNDTDAWIAFHEAYLKTGRTWCRASSEWQLSHAV